VTRRQFAGAGAAVMAWRGGAQEKVALVSIALDCEMSAHYPTWEQTEWNYKKGDLDEATKEYAVGAARRVAAAGGKMHFFVVGRVFEHPSVAWLEEIVKLGHGVGNHTYDHVNVKATEVSQTQYRFARAPWLAHGKTATELIDQNIRMCAMAMKDRLGMKPNGFRTPGGFPNGLKDRPDLQNMLLAQGYTWVSSLYPRHPVKPDTGAPQAGELEAIPTVQEAAQPFVYPTGLLDIPMNPISDIGAFRNGRWKLEHFLKAIRMGVEWAIEKQAVFDFLAHPACLSAMDPEFRVIELICELVGKAGNRASLVNLETIAAQAKPR